MNSPEWSSRLHFMLAAIGAAVGLGSIWKFPYMVGMQGGSAFVLLVILATFLIGIPILIAEILLGFIGRGSIISSLTNLCAMGNISKRWLLLGWWGALILLIILSLYSVVGGWSLAYMYKAIVIGFTNKSNQELITLWSSFLASPLSLSIWHSLFLFATLWVVRYEIQAGVERASKIMLPGLMLALIILLIYNASIGDFSAAAKFLFKLDFSKINNKVIVSALGQAAFSLAIGAGCMLTYGCYLNKQTPIVSTVFIIALAVIIVSLLSGLAIFPVVFAFELPPESGPGLMFKVLPMAFAKLPFGDIFAAIFFLMLWFAAWTSSISMAEPLVLILKEQFKLTRLQGVILIWIFCWTLGLFSLLAFNVLSDVNICQKDIFSFMTDIAIDFMLPLGALGFAIFAGWKLNAITAKNCLQLPSFWFNCWHFAIKYLAPSIIIVLIMV